jgi:succinoglycan biosynthesis transport protein ExoP
MDARPYNDAAHTAVQTSDALADRPGIDLHRHIALFRRRLRLFCAIALIVFIATVIITFQLTPKYTATAEVMLDRHQQRVSDVQEVLTDVPPDTTAVDTEVEVLKSRNLAEKVVGALQLDKDPEFNRALAPKSFFSFLKPKPKINSAEDNVKATNAIVDNLIGGLKVARSGLSYAINVSYTSKSASKSAAIANSFADQYLLEQLDAKFDATRRASDWLNSRLSGLKSQVEQAEAAVAQYKAAHGLMGISGGVGATIAQQEITNIDTQLAGARAQQAEADASLSTARKQLERGSTGDDLGAALNSPVINGLRQQRAEISSQVADMSGRLGPRHPDMLKAQRQLADIDAQIHSEIVRIVSNLEAQDQVARQRTASIESSLSNSKGALAANGNASVQLNDLQRNADSLAALYQTYLDRFKQTSNQGGMEQSDSRVVSRAKIPVHPTFPNKPLMAVLGLALGIAAAIGAAVLVEALENGLYTSEDVEKILGFPHLGSIPLANSMIDSKNKIKGPISPTRYVIDKPLSGFAEAFRNLRTSILFSKVGEPVRVIAVTSALPGEGKTTTCICLGRVIAMGGIQTVVVDCDLRRRTVNRLFAEEPKVGLLEVLAGTSKLEDALIYDDASGAHFLPLAKASYTPKDVFASAAMDQLLVDLKARFEVVLLDTAPVLPVADTRVLAPKADVTVFLAQWRKTPRKAVENAIGQLESVGAFIAGVGITQMDMKEQARSGYGDAGYYYRAYRQYYQV